MLGVLLDPELRQPKQRLLRMSSVGPMIQSDSTWRKYRARAQAARQTEWKERQARARSGAGHGAARWRNRPNGVYAVDLIQFGIDSVNAVWAARATEQQEIYE